MRSFLKLFLTVYYDNIIAQIPILNEKINFKPNSYNLTTTNKIQYNTSH